MQYHIQYKTKILQQPKTTHNKNSLYSTTFYKHNILQNTNIFINKTIYKYKLIFTKLLQNIYKY